MNVALFMMHNITEIKPLTLIFCLQKEFHFSQSDLVDFATPQLIRPFVFLLRITKLRT
jgi:hypothetical protein